MEPKWAGPGRFSAVERPLANGKPPFKVGSKSRMARRLLASAGAHQNTRATLCEATPERRGHLLGVVDPVVAVDRWAPGALPWRRANKQAVVTFNSSGVVGIHSQRTGSTRPASQTIDRERSAKRNKTKQDTAQSRT